MTIIIFRIQCNISHLSKKKKNVTFLTQHVDYTIVYIPHMKEMFYMPTAQDTLLKGRSTPNIVWSLQTGPSLTLIKFWSHPAEICTSSKLTYY